MMEEQDYEEEYLRDQALIRAEEKARLEAEWQELEYDNQLPAKITVLIQIPEKHEKDNIYSTED
jgi:hypothetical protein